ncbi:MAG: DUF5106 domain-containing protein [Muribaculaceae bacterium]|nr:DUF5106 domain-containing protein [Muribaculaceae bacterium]
MKRFLYILLVAIGLISGGNASSQTTLFEFPVAPDTCSDIESRCNYSVQHFWDNCNLTKPFEAGSDSLLVDAMVTYFDIMRAGANVNVSLSSVRDLMFKAQANHDNFMKLIGVAEYLLYYHDFDFIDDLYVAFAKSAADASWAKKDARNHYGEQCRRIEASKLGSPIYNFEFTSITGARKHLFDVKSDAKLYVIMFSDNGSGSSIERMRLSTDIAFGQAVESGQVEVINIVIGDTPKKWDSDSQSYSERWIVGASKEVSEKLDLRIIPCIYILDENFTVIAKNKTVDFVKNLTSR